MEADKSLEAEIDAFPKRQATIDFWRWQQSKRKWLLKIEVLL